MSIVLGRRFTSGGIMDRLLFIDDDVEILNINQKFFQQHGYIADVAADTETALELLNKQDYQCILLDICMAGTNGLDFCRELRQNRSIPVIFLSNMAEEEYLIEAFHCGADDYVTKPYSLPVLELRIRTRIRNTGTVQDSPDEALVLNSVEKQAYLNHCSLRLTANEYEILNFLKAHEGQPFRQEEIYYALWGEHFYNTHSIQVMIMRIRKKMMALSPGHEYIKTQWGKGYVYVG